MPGPPRSGGGGLLLLGLGNDLLCDDAIGLRVVEAARPLLNDQAGVTVASTSEMGLSLLDLIVGFQSVVLVDSVQTARVPAGTVHEFDAKDLASLCLVSPHFLGVGEVLALGRKLGLRVPDEVRVFAIEVADPFTVSTRMTRELEKLLPTLVQRLVSEIRNACGYRPIVQA